MQPSEVADYRIVGTAATGLPVFQRPLLAGLRMGVNELLGRRGAASRLRWAVRNAETRQVCACGAPATVARRDVYQRPDYGGPVFYACDRHSGVPLSAIPLSAGDRRCRKGCGWRQYLADDGSAIGGGGPTVTAECDHEWGACQSYLPVGAP